MSELSGYVFSPLREGDIALYRGSGNGLAPILLVAAEETSLGCIQRLEHEYALKAELDADWAARPIALTHHNDRMTLVLEDPGGVPLDRLLGRPLGRIAFPARRDPDCGGAPPNAWPRPDPQGYQAGKYPGGRGKRRRVADGVRHCLASAARAPGPRATGGDRGDAGLHGAGANRQDEPLGQLRSDLYALGVTFYEMLTGQLPFTAADPMEWVHCHVARQPVPPNEQGAGVPAPLSAIVMKLLAKTAEERYQTAAGVEADLRRCLAAWEAYRRIDQFPLGKHDGSDRLLIPERLYGREREIDILLASFDRVVANGTFELG